MQLANLPFSPAFRAAPGQDQQAGASSQLPEEASPIFVSYEPSTSAPSPHAPTSAGTATGLGLRRRLSTNARASALPPPSTSNAFSKGTPRVDPPRTHTPSALSLLFAQHAS
ncbi:hypothetical protein AURDEDRAFT_111908, partial [Auricularia subglabra TFB-10046 SS5]